MGLDFYPNEITKNNFVSLRIEAVGGDLDRVVCRYPQSFLDEMARQLTAEIQSALGVTGVAESSVQLVMAFAQDTYLEHISENVTYRRLMLSDKVSAPRDFWVKWTRLAGEITEYSAENIRFELGEDVSQKIREKEYRYLLATGKDSYHNSMGRKKVTEWREVIRRAVKRGELSKIESDLELSPEIFEIEARIASLLGKSAPATSTQNEEVSYVHSDESAFESALEKMRRVVDATSEIDNAECETENAEFEKIEEVEEAEETDIFEEVEESVEEAEENAEVLEEAFSLFDAVDEEDEEISNSELEIQEEEADGILDLGFEIDKDEADEEDNSEFDILEEETVEIQNSEFEIRNDEADEIADPEIDALDDKTEAVEEELVEVEEAPAAEEIVEETSKAEEIIEETSEAEEIVEEIPEVEEIVEEIPEVEEVVKEETPVATPLADRAAYIRAEIEAKIRLEYESKARIKAEEELIALKCEYHSYKAESETLLAETKRELEILKLEYHSFLQETKRREMQRMADEAQRAAEEKELRLQIETQLRREAQERERLEEAARVAIEEQRRLEEAARVAIEEQRRLEEAARVALEEQRRLELENAQRILQREEQARIEAEARRREEEERINEANRLAALEQARREEEEREKAKTAMPDMTGRYTYTSKTVKLIFRRSVDPNITNRIHEIIKATVDYYGKDNISLRIKAMVLDSQTVVLEFTEIPLEEMALLGNIVKIIGNSGLGIAKAIIE